MMSESQGEQQNTTAPSDGVVQEDGHSADQHPSYHSPAWLIHVSNLQLDQLPHAPASFVFGSVQHDPSQTSSIRHHADSSVNHQYVALNIHPAYTSSLNPNSANASQVSQLAVTSAINEIQTADSYQPENSSSLPQYQPSDEDYVRHEPLLPATHHQLWSPSTIISSISPNHTALGELTSHFEGPQQWQTHFRLPSFPLAPQNVESEQELLQHTGLSSMVDGLTAHPILAATPDSLVRPPGIEHQIPNIVYNDHLPDAESAMEIDSVDRTSETRLSVSKKRRHSEIEQHARPTRRRTGKRGRPKGRRGVEGPRSVLDPGLEFSRLYNDAMDAFIEENDAAKAQVTILEAIAVNPEIFAAHSLLADIYFSQGNHEAAIDALMIGLHAHINDVDLWRQVADTILNDHTEGYGKRVERAMYCFSGILRKTPKDLDARFQRAECARVLGNWNKAFSDLNILLQDDPHNSAILAQFFRVCQGVGDLSQAKVLYGDHFEYYETTGLTEENHFTWQDISNYVDVLTSTGQTAKALSEFRRLARWLCGRQLQAYWDQYDDDREFDQTHYPRRLEVPEFDPGNFSEQEYGEAIPLDLRGKLGVLRLKLNFREEAQAHFDWLEPELEGEDSLVHEYSDTFYEIATGLLDVKEYRIALQFFEALHKAEIDPGYEFWIGLGACCFVCGRKEEAVQHYEHALQIKSDAIEPRTQLAKLYNDRGDRTKALKYGREAVIMAQNAIPATVNRKYERKEQRLVREAATKALQMAYKMPTGPGKAPGKVPDDLKRGRRTRRFVKYVPRYTERPETVDVSSSSDEEEEEDADIEQRSDEPMEVDINDEDLARDSDERKKAKKNKASTRRNKSPKKPKTPRTKVSSSEKQPKIPKTRYKPRRQPPNQEDAIKHYEGMQQLYHTLLNNQDAMREGDEAATLTWMDCADALVRDFRTVKAFYPAERHKKFDASDKDFPRPTIAPSRASNPAGSREQSHLQIQSEEHNHSSVELEAGQGLLTEYCGIAFPNWLDLHLEFAILIANSVNRTSDTQKDCYDVLTATTDCAIFYHDERSMTQIHTCWLVCALSLGDDVTLFNHVLRWFMREFAFCTDTYRLYSAIAFLNELPASSNGRAGQLQSAEFKASPNQKFIFRQIVSIDKLLPADYNTDGAEGGVPAFMRRHREELRKISKAATASGTTTGEDPLMANRGTSSKDTAENQLNVPNGTSEITPAKSRKRDSQQAVVAVKVVRPQEMDVVLFVLYAHILMSSGSFTNALSYLYRAYCLDPSNTVVLLSISFCYMHELFKRQNENRHMYVLYAWAWFGKYEVERLAWAEQIDEEQEIAEDESSLTNQDLTASKENGTTRDATKMIDVVRAEIDFNKARCWDMLGMADLAVRGYTKVLNSSVQKSKVEQTSNEDRDSEDWSMEAAYAMSTIYAINGNISKAREITEKFLVVE